MYRFDDAEVTPAGTTLHVPAGGFFYLHGHFELRLDAGACVVNGADLAPGPHRVDQPYHLPALFLYCPERAVLHVGPAPTRHEALNALPRSFLARPRVAADTALSAAVFPFGGVRVVREADLPVFAVPAEWRAVAARVDATAACGPVRVAVVGPKGAGKSTLVALLRNTLVLRGPVCVLDLDPGQPTSGLVGCVSLLVHDAQDLNENVSALPPAAAHRFVYGSSSLSAPPPLLLASVRKAVALHARRYAGLPLLVNTAGWVSGFGLELLAAELELARCHLHVELAAGQAALPPLPGADGACVRVVVPAFPRRPSPLQNVLKPALRRSLCLAAFFVDARWYAIPLRRVLLAFVHPVDDDAVLAAIDRRYVFLAHTARAAELVAQHDADLPLVTELRDTPTPVLAVATARVDADARRLLVRTALPPDAMATVNTVVYSSAMDDPVLPALLGDAPAPYMAFDQAALGAERTPFKYLPRN